MCIKWNKRPRCPQTSNDNVSDKSVAWQIQLKAHTETQRYEYIFNWISRELLFTEKENVLSLVSLADTRTQIESELYHNMCWVFTWSKGSIYDFFFFLKWVDFYAGCVQHVFNKPLQVQIYKNKNVYCGHL